VLAGCTGPSATQPGEQTAPGLTGAGSGEKDGPYRIAVVTHGTAGDAFWNVVKNGAVQAGKDLDAKVTYNAEGDPAGQAKLIDNAVAQKTDGLVVSMANPPALKASIERAVKAGIPVVTINSGEAESAHYGAIGHVGQNEALAGEAAGKRFKAAGKKKLLCVIHEAGNIGQNQRCKGAEKGFGGPTRTLQVDIANPTDTQSRIKGQLQTDKSIDAVLALNSQVAARASTAVGDTGSKAQVATFDLNEDVVKGIKEDRILFAVDQQQYEQGYLPVVMLKLYLANANTVGGGGPVLTGPGFVDKSNVDTIGTYVKRGTR
jgi:simple sugar transport system substrate-binding protein